MSSLLLNWLHLDLNCYFASVEQQLQSALRGRPVAVIPVRAETTCCIAVSYEARAFGVCTGLPLRTAQKLCPQLKVVEARPKLYVEMHSRIAAAITRCVPIEEVLSCDEFACRLVGRQRQLTCALDLAAAIKQAIRIDAGQTLCCSIGLGPNRLLAKIAAGAHKPDGLTAITRHDLPDALWRLGLQDIPGIGERMERRLRFAGISTVRDLCALSRQRMAELWGGVVGERLWLELWGEDIPVPLKRPPQTISRQHILPPALRTLEGCRATALKLLHDCGRRMRRQGLYAGGLGLAVYFLQHDHVFEADCKITPCQDSITLQEHFLPLLSGIPSQMAGGLCVFLTHLAPARALDLFASAQTRKRAAASAAMEAVHRRFDKNAVFLGSVFGVRRAAPARISFGPPPPLDEFKGEEI